MGKPEERKYTREQITKALKASNIKGPEDRYSYDVEMCSEFFWEQLEKASRTSQERKPE